MCKFKEHPREKYIDVVNIVDNSSVSSRYKSLSLLGISDSKRTPYSKLHKLLIYKHNIIIKFVRLPIFRILLITNRQ